MDCSSASVAVAMNSPTIVTWVLQSVWGCGLLHPMKTYDQMRIEIERLGDRALQAALDSARDNARDTCTEEGLDYESLAWSARFEVVFAASLQDVLAFTDSAPVRAWFAQRGHVG